MGLRGLKGELGFWGVGILGIGLTWGSGDIVDLGFEVLGFMFRFRLPGLEVNLVYGSSVKPSLQACARVVAGQDLPLKRP